MLKKYLPSRKTVAIAATISAAVAFASAELAVRLELNKNVEGLLTESNDSALGPRLCKIGSDAIKENLTPAELRMLEGLYRDARQVKPGTSISQIFNRTRAIDAALQASLRIGYPLGMLINNMNLESTIGYGRLNKKSSARGNMHSLNGTWMEIFKKYIPGDPYYGTQYEALAKQIELIKPTGEKERFGVPDEQIDRKILDLRLIDPDLEAYLFAKMFAAKNAHLIRGNRSSSAAIRAMSEAYDEALMRLPARLRLMLDSDFKQQYQDYLAHMLGETGRRTFNGVSWFGYYLGSADTYMRDAVKSNESVFKNCHTVDGKKICTSVKTPREAQLFIARRLHETQEELRVQSVPESNLAQLCYRR